MGCDIHIFAEKKEPTTEKWVKIGKVFTGEDNEKTDKPFDWRSYGLFGFFADVRNYSKITPLSKRKGLPTNSEYLDSPSDDNDDNDVFGTSIRPRTRRQDLLKDGDYHSFSFLTLKELLSVDYNSTFEDRGITIQESPNLWNGAGMADEGSGTITTYKEFLGDFYMKHLKELQEQGEPENVRIVFWFDN